MTLQSKPGSQGWERNPELNHRYLLTLAEHSKTDFKQHKGTVAGCLVSHFNVELSVFLPVIFHKEILTGLPEWTLSWPLSLFLSFLLL